MHCAQYHTEYTSNRWYHNPRIRLVIFDSRRQAPLLLSKVVCLIMMSTAEVTGERDKMTQIDSATAKLVYQSLSLEGAATATELSERLDLPKLTILSVLSTLQKREIVTEYGDTGDERQYIVA